jgi:hypothetical protein
MALWVHWLGDVVIASLHGRYCPDPWRCEDEVKIQMKILSSVCRAGSDGTRG